MQLPTSKKTFLIIGGGIAGLATALQLTETHPDATLTLLEKEDDVGKHQSSHNSGVLHAGLYYKPGSKKARLAVSGIRKMIAFCVENDIAHEVCGKLVVATQESERPRLMELFSRGQQNGLKGLRLLEADALKAIEPHVAGIAAVHVPEEGIVSYAAVCQALKNKLQSRGVSLILNARVTRLLQKNSRWIALTAQGKYEADFLYNCAGLYCDEVAELAGEVLDAQIIPFRGDYFKLKKPREHLVKHLIYPVPDPLFPFLGVHFTRMIGGGVECGPNAVLAFAREGYTLNKVNMKEFSKTLAFPGFWKFLSRYPKQSMSELHSSVSKRAFCHSLQKLIPEITMNDLEPGGAGVRAQAISRNGDLIQDFHIVRRLNAVHLVNAPSPGATSSLALGEWLVRGEV